MLVIVGVSSLKFGSPSKGLGMEGSLVISKKKTKKEEEEEGKERKEKKRVKLLNVICILFFVNLEEFFKLHMVAFEPKSQYNSTSWSHQDLQHCFPNHEERMSIKD